MMNFVLACPRPLSRRPKYLTVHDDSELKTRVCPHAPTTSLLTSLPRLPWPHIPLLPTGYVLSATDIAHLHSDTPIMTSTTVTQTEQLPLGAALPPFTAHAISVSLPTWRDNVGYEEGEKRVVDAMVSGYPRFFIHLSIQKVSTPP